MAGQQNQGMRAGRKAGFFVGRPLGTGAEAPEIFWVLLYLYKSTSPGGEISPRPIPVPPAGDIIRGRRPQGAALRAGRPEAAPLRSPMAACVQGAAGADSPCQGEMSRRDKRGRDKPPPYLGTD